MDLDGVARAQHGVVTIAQAREAGLSEDAVRWRVATRRWRRIAHGLYQTHTGELGWLGRASAALLRAGDGAALSHESAAFLHGLLARPPQIISVAVPRGRNRDRLPGTRLHRRRRIVSVTRQQLRVTAAAQTVVDRAGVPGTAWREAVNICAAAVQRRRTTAADIAAELLSHPRHPHRRVLQVALGIIGAGAECAAEVDYVSRVERPHGLPASRLQVHASAGGVAVRRDAEYQEYGVVVEIDGPVGHGPDRRCADNRRDRKAAAAGKVTLRADNAEVYAAPCDLADDVLRTLGSRGYRGGRGCRPRCPLA